MIDDFDGVRACLAVWDVEKDHELQRGLESYDLETRAIVAHLATMPRVHPAEDVFEVARIVARVFTRYRRQGFLGGSLEEGYGRKPYTIQECMAVAELMVDGTIERGI